MASIGEGKHSKHTWRIGFGTKQPVGELGHGPEHVSVHILSVDTERLPYIS